VFKQVLRQLKGSLRLCPAPEPFEMEGDEG
jgi:hypothetical protein